MPRSIFQDEPAGASKQNPPPNRQIHQQTRLTNLLQNPPQNPPKIRAISARKAANRTLHSPVSLDCPTFAIMLCHFSGLFWNRAPTKQALIKMTETWNAPKAFKRDAPWPSVKYGGQKSSEKWNKKCCKERHQAHRRKFFSQSLLLFSVYDSFQLRWAKSLR